jgi:hypothetical protein
MSATARSRSSVIALLIIGQSMTACSDRVASPFGLPQPSSISARPQEAQRVASSDDTLNFSAARARFQAEFKKRPDFTKLCTDLGDGSARMSKMLGCPAASLASPPHAPMHDQLDDEFAEMQAEVDALVAEVDNAWNGGREVYTVASAVPSGTQQSMSVMCRDLMNAALVSTGTVAAGVAAFAASSLLRMAPLAKVAVSWLRNTVPIAVSAISVYVGACSDGGTPEPKQPR